MTVKESSDLILVIILMETGIAMMDDYDCVKNEFVI